MFKVQKKMCATCIYRPTSPLNLEKLENDVRERIRGKPVDFFKGHRICHHSKDVCCRGFWEKHKDRFALGQIAQRLGMVTFVDVDTLKGNDRGAAKNSRGKSPKRGAAEAQKSAVE